MKSLPQIDRKEVGIWIRVSTEDQARGESPEHHEQRARQYAALKGWTVKEKYDLAGFTGKSVLEYPETKRMLEDIRTGRITALIFSKLARLARNTRELLDFADIFRECNADLVSLQESIDTSSPSGRLFYTMIAGMAQWEREEIAERVAASVPIRAKLGKSLGGAAPLGYRWHERRLMPHPDEAVMVRKMFELFAKHHRKRMVARLLNEAGYRTRNRSLFTQTTISRLLQDPVSKGLRRMNHSKSLGNKKHWVRKPESEWIIQEVEPIVPIELWDECNRILAEQRANAKPRTKPATQLFSGLTFCSCGHKMYVLSNSAKYVCQKCRNKVPIDDLEAVFAEQLKSFLLSPDDVAEHLQKIDGEISGKEAQIADFQKRLRALGSEMDAVYQLYLDKQISSEGFGSRYRPMEEQKAQIEAELPKLQAEVDLLKVNLISSDESLQQAIQLYSRWFELSFQEKRTIVETIVDRIEIGKGEIEINLLYLPPSKNVAKEERNLMDSSRRSTSRPREKPPCPRLG
ncbi:MAG: recombinase family protein [Chthoniobacterales bacterium]